MAALHRAGEIADTIRLYSFHPSVLIGRHQLASREVRVERCRKKQIEIARRMTGGGAVYMDAGVLAWDVVVDHGRFRNHHGEAGALICAGIARGLSRLGLPARYRAHNEVEIDGRRVSGSSGFFDGPTFVCQGTVLVEFRPDRMAEVLHLPTGTSQRKAAAALSERLVGIADILGRVPAHSEIQDALAAGLAETLRRSCRREANSAAELALAARLLAEEYGTDDFIFGDPPQAGTGTRVGRRSVRSGLIEAHVRLRPGTERRIDQIWITGPFTATPARAIPDLETALRDLPVEAAPQRALGFLSDEGTLLSGASPADIAAVIAAAAAPAARQGRAR
jgi:lipoate-protein ligase A